MGSLSSTSDWSALKLPIPEWAVVELVERGVIDPEERVQPPEIITPVPSDDPKSKHYVEGVFFDVDEVVRVCTALSMLRHIKGRWRGRPLRPAAWQVLYLIAPVFGWRTEATDEFGEVRRLRVIRSAWVEVPRKNGKSTLSSGLAIVLLVADREPGAEVYAAAASREQAGAVFSPAKAMVQQSPALRGKVKPLSNLLRVPATDGVFRALSKMGDTAQGLNPSGAVVDEVHVHKSRDLIDALDTGDGAREQPLTIYITTSDDGSRTTIYAEKRTEIETLAADLGDSATDTYGVVWMAPETMDACSREAIEAANPGLEITVTEAYLMKRAARAQRSPSFMPTYERLYLNRRRNAITRAIDMETWDASGAPAFTIDAARRAMRDRVCYGALDLATTEDFAAWVLVFPLDDGKLAVLPRLWLPQAAVDRRPSMRSTLDMWARDGWITITDGDVVDFDRIEADVSADAEAFQVKEFAYDPWQAEALRQRLQQQGLEGWKCPQTMAHMAPATLELERRYQKLLLHHGGNPALAWMASNVVAKPDANERWKPEKKLSAEKIDGVVATVMAIAALIRERKDEQLPAPATGTSGGGPSDDFFRPTSRLTI